MLKALRASVMLLVLVGTAHAGEIVIPPAPHERPQSDAPEPTAATLYAEEGPSEVSDGLTDTALGLLAILTTLL